MITNMISNKKLNQLVTELLIRGYYENAKQLSALTNCI